MTTRALPRSWRAWIGAGGAAATVLTIGCASVLDVDEDYTLIDAGSALDAGADGSTTSTQGVVRCATNAPPCEAGAQECCLSSTDTFACVARSTTSDPCPSGTDIPCDDPSDCAGASCCLSLDGQGDILGTTCAASCSNGAITLCAPGGTCATGACEAITVQPSPPVSNPWFYGCR